MTETADSAPRSSAVPRHVLANGPRAVILADHDQIRFGDILLDTLGGALRVDEIVRRRRSPVAEFAEYRTRIRPSGPDLAIGGIAELRHVINHTVAYLRIARDIDHFGPLRGHHTRVRSHNPVRRGMYVLNDGWLAECSCGWPRPGEKQVHGGNRSARREWLEHKAAVIGASACEGHPGLALVTTAERDHCLPPLPWEFAHNGVAVVRLDALGLGRGVQAAQAWADALGSPVEHDGLKDCKTVHITAPKPGTGTAAVSIDGYFALDGEAGQ